jgi:hypothetical protein
MYSHLMGRAPSKEHSLRKMVESTQDRKISVSPISAIGHPPETPPGIIKEVSQEMKLFLPI